MLNAYRTKLPRGGSVLWLDPRLSPIFLKELNLAIPIPDTVQVNWVEFELNSGVVSRVNYWNGSAWAIGNTKYWNGSAWILASMKTWNGLIWV